METQEAAFFNRFGQLIYKEPLGRRAGYRTPQFSIHRGDLHAILLDAVRSRLGEGGLHLGWHCTGFEQDEAKVRLSFKDRAPVEGKAAIGCDGIHSVIRRQLYPAEGEPHYTGVNMWRGVTRWKPILSGATMLRAGWSFGRVTLLGDAAHPMVPRGSNGAGQAILDAECMADNIDDLKSYENKILDNTSRVVLENRNPPGRLPAGRRLRQAIP